MLFVACYNSVVYIAAFDLCIVGLFASCCYLFVNYCTCVLFCLC